jgi:hypothetical protein
MYTQWLYPQTITQYTESEEHIPWREGADMQFIRYPGGNLLGTVAPLLRIANTTVKDIAMKTYYLKLSDWNLDQIFQKIVGIELELAMNRGGRITDDSIMIMKPNKRVGNNLANIDLSPIKQYGGTSSQWNYKFTPQNLTNEVFSISLRFRSHPEWPHRETPRIDYVRLRALLETS